MLKNYVTIALRGLRRRKGYAALNIVGLAVGIACCVLIGLYVRHEWSYDRFHANADRLYRVAQAMPNEDAAGMGAALGPALAEDFPQIEAAVRFIRNDKLVAVEHPATGDVRRFEEKSFVYADPAVLTAFSFPLVQGDPATALARPGTVVLTEETARRYFGDADPMGRTLHLAGDEEPFPLTVTGVMEDVPTASHLSFDLLTSYDTFKAEQGIPVGEQMTSYWWPWGWTYVLLEEGADAEALEAQLGDFAERRRGDRTFTPFLQPITGIHLHSDLLDEWEANGSAATVGVLGAIALFVLLLACVNFVNLATARAAERAREVGVRKSVGAGRGQVARQFLGEALLLTGAALALALALARLALPVFNNLAGTSLGFAAGDPLFWAALGGLLLLVGLGAGGYPALVLSRFEPARVLKSSGAGRTTGAGGAALRKGLVVFQFTVSVALMAATAIAFQQLGYLRTADLGFDEARVAAVPLKATAPAVPLQEALLRQPGVEAVTFASDRPGFGARAEVPFEAEGDRIYAPPEQAGPTNEDADYRTRYQVASAGYFNLMDIEVITGREFSDARSADLGDVLRDDEHAGVFFRGRAKILNRAAVEALGWTPEEALGKTFRMYTQEGGTYYMDTQGEIVGVVENIHTSSMRERIIPMVYEPAAVPGGGTFGLNYALVKLAPGSAAGAMGALEAAWNEVAPEVPFEASFLDEALDNRYEREQRLGQIFTAFAGLALLIACLGLFGLAAYTAQQRTKEIGIRKALGASAASIVALLSKGFLRLVAVAVVLAVPLAYLGMRRWLEGFAYRIDLGPGVFLAVGAAALGIALLTVSYQALKAARTNPTEALRGE